MKTGPIIAAGLLAGMLGMTVGAMADDAGPGGRNDQQRQQQRERDPARHVAPQREQGKEMEKTMEREKVYGWQLMTDAERAAYRERMRNAETEEERERIRAEHHQAMQQRAAEMGVELPARPPADRGPRSSRDGGNR